MLNDSGKGYWDEVAQEFDTFYGEEKGILRRVIDNVFRKGMTERFNLALEECKNVNGKKVLDIGCGSGRLSVELAKRGAYVVGIDFSPKMLNMASLAAKKQGLEDKCTFIQNNFVNHVFNEHFHISIALGFFDYTKDPVILLEKVKSLTTEKCIMSFPSKFAFQVPIRMIWLRSRNCSVYFYTRKGLNRLLSERFTRFRIKDISALYFCVAYV